MFSFSFFFMLIELVLLFFFFREIPRHDAKSLVILLQSNDTALLERTLTTISNGATIPANQVSTLLMWMDSVL